MAARGELDDAGDGGFAGEAEDVGAWRAFEADADAVGGEGDGVSAFEIEKRGVGAGEDAEGAARAGRVGEAAGGAVADGDVGPGVLRADFEAVALS